MSAELRTAIAALVHKRDLSQVEMRAAMQAILAGEATPAEIAGLAVAMRMKGETTEELFAAADVMRQHSVKVDLGAGTIVDTCGTGGDGAGSFNVSTAAAIVVAACGVTVAKHGNRAVSSQCGSADVLEALGITLDVPEERLRQQAMCNHICFMFAPVYHPSLRHAAVPRRELGIRTFFNLLGPLTNPAGANCQLLGVYDAARLRQMAEVLARLGSRRAWVVHGHGGIDEMSASGPTQVVELSQGSLRSFELFPHNFGFEAVEHSAISGGDAKRNAEIIINVLHGVDDAYRRVVLINAAGALLAAGECDNPQQGVQRAAEAIDSGAAWTCLQEWIRLSHSTP